VSLGVIATGAAAGVFNTKRALVAALVRAGPHKRMRSFSVIKTLLQSRALPVWIIQETVTVKESDDRHFGL